MVTLAWSHNLWYEGLLLRRLPPRPGRVLDVGCGDGHLSARLVARAEHVEALDRDPTMVAAARAALSDAVVVRRADLLTDPLPESRYDAIVTTREVREQARAALPGVRVRRLLFWRYLLEYRRPSA